MSELFSPLSPQQQAAMMNAAKQRAVELRNEAIAQFWASLRLAIRSAWARTTLRAQHGRTQQHKAGAR